MHLLSVLFLLFIFNALLKKHCLILVCSFFLCPPFSFHAKRNNKTLEKIIRCSLFFFSFLFDIFEKIETLSRKGLKSYIQKIIFISFRLTEIPIKAWRATGSWLLIMCVKSSYSKVSLLCSIDYNLLTNLKQLQQIWNKHKVQKSICSKLKSRLTTIDICQFQSFPSLPYLVCLQWFLSLVPQRYSRSLKEDTYQQTLKTTEERKQTFFMEKVCSDVSAYYFSFDLTYIQLCEDTKWSKNTL